MRSNCFIYMFLAILFFSCKEQVKNPKQEKDKTDKEEIKTNTKKTPNKTYADAIRELKIEKLPFSYNAELLDEYNRTSADETIIEDLLHNKTKDYYDCTPSIYYEESLIFSDTLFYYIAKKEAFKMNVCKTLKRFITKDKIDVILATVSINEYEILMCLTLKNKKIKDHKVLSKLVASDEYNQFGIRISKDFQLESVNYSYYESAPFMVKRTIKINDNASISVTKEMSVELDE